MSFSLRAKFRNAQSRVSMKETNTILELKEAISKSIFIPIEQQRIFSDWKEATSDEVTLQEAGINKKSKILIFEKKEIIDTPNNIVDVTVEYNEEKVELKMNKEHYFMDLIVSFFKDREFPEKMDDMKLKQKTKNIKIDEQIKDFQNFQQNPIRIVIAEKSAKKSKTEEPASAPTPQSEQPKVEEVSQKPKEVSQKPKEEKKERTPKKEKTPKKAAVQSMNIMSFLRPPKKTETATPPRTPVKEIPPLQETVTPETQEESKSIFEEAVNAIDKPSIDSLLSAMKNRMKEFHDEGIKRVIELRKQKEAVVISIEEKEQEKEEVAEVTEKVDSDSAVIEVVNEFEEEDEDIVSITPPLFVEAAPSAKHMIMTINKNNLTPLQLLTLPHILGFRYIHPDTDTDRRRVFFGISKASSSNVTGRSPLGHDDRVDYSHDSDDSEDELNDDEIQGDDCNDTESENSEAEDATNRLDYGDGFLEEEDINIGDANMTAEERSALVFRSVSGNKGRMSQQMKMSNQPVVLSCKDGDELKQCKAIICDPIFFTNTIATMRKHRIEMSVGEEVEAPVAEAPRSAKKVNMSSEMVQELKDMIVGQSFTISQINDKMQEKYPGLPKRQIEHKLHELAEKKHKKWVLRDEQSIETKSEFKPAKIITELTGNGVKSFGGELKPTPVLSIPVDLDTVISTRTISLPPPEFSQHKREREENSDEAVITTIDFSTHSHSEKRQRIQPERIPDGSIIHGNISHSAFATNPTDNGPSSFVHYINNK